MIHPRSPSWWVGLLLGLLAAACAIDYGARTSREAEPPFPVISTTP